MLHPELQRAVNALDLKGSVPRLEAASLRSERIVTEAKAFLRGELNPTGIPLDVVVFGSVARQEASPRSDFDCLVVAHGLPEKVGQTRELLNATKELPERLRLKKPGRSGLFNTVISAPDLTERIGLEQDTNLTHSRRVLLLQESVSLYKPDLHRSLISAILDRYLSYRWPPKKGVPRFLLNDVVRYWRTIAVDYQAKRWEEYGEPGWGLRFLKLVIPRKLAFAGTLASILLCKEANVEYFQKQFDMPALARLAQLHVYADDMPYRDALRTTLLIAEEFGDAMATGLADEATKIRSRSEITEGSRFANMRGRAQALQEALETLFFSEPLARRAHTYALF